MKIYHHLIFCAVGLLLAATIGCVQVTSNPSSSNKSTSNNNAGKPNYEKYWSGAGLPEIPGGEITDYGKAVRNLNDGIRFKLTVKKTIPEVAKFYTEKLSALGWEYKEPPIPWTKMFLCEFKKGAKRISINANPNLDEPTESNVTIAYSEN